VTDEPSLDDVLVCVRGRLADVPVVALPDGLTLRDLDPDDPDDVRRWLHVQNAAFDRDWTAENHRLAMRENPYVVVDRTYVAERDGEPVGIASTGRFRGNPAVGIGHYLAVHPSAQRSGLALALCSRRYRDLAATGIEVAEAQTHLHRVGSLRAHFRCGFEPKADLDPWNSVVPTGGPLREEADRRLAELHADWLAAR
jgi:GNAT superfamily N-acetyltransferase